MNREECGIVFRYRDFMDQSERVRSPLIAVAVVLLLIMPLQAQAAMVTGMTPYVQAVTQNNIYVMVECTTVGTVTVEYGPTTGYGSTATTVFYLQTTASPLTYVHRVKLTGLSPNTQYHYRASQDGAWSNDKAFYSAVEPGTPFKFAAYADTRTYPVDHNGIAGLVKAQNPRFTILCGDPCDNSSYTSFKTEWFVSNELALQATAPTYNSTGNHETWGTNTQAFFQSPASTSATQAYYSFDYGDVHFVNINCYTTYSVGSTQYNWVAGDLASSTKPWKIVFFHNPAYCCGDGHGEDATMIQYSNNIFVPRNVDLVLTGHLHVYQHNLVSGINHLVIGTAGAPFHVPCTPPKSYTILSAQQKHYAILDVTPTTLHMDVINSGGTVIDKLDLVKTVAAAKTKPDSTVVDIMSPSIVTHVPSEAKVFYVQDPDGISGIRVETNGTKPAVGAKVLVRGKLATLANGERAMQDAIVTNKVTGTTPAYGMPNRSVGGSAYVGTNTLGLSNQGLMVRVWGKVTKVSGNVFWIDDGSGVASSEIDGTKGLKIIESGLTPGGVVKLAGVVASEKVDGQLYRVIRYHESLP